MLLNDTGGRCTKFPEHASRLSVNVGQLDRMSGKPHLRKLNFRRARRATHHPTSVGSAVEQGTLAGLHAELMQLEIRVTLRKQQWPDNANQSWRKQAGGSQESKTDLGVLKFTHVVRTTTFAGALLIARPRAA